MPTTTRSRRLAARARATAAAAATATATLAALLSPIATPAAGAATPAVACDGRWHAVASPSPGSDRDLLMDVATLAADDAWAVGSTTSQETGFTTPLTVHWDGSAWDVVDTPIDSAAILTGVTMIAPDDVWAVGYKSLGLTETRPLALHWDGSSWSKIETPSIDISNLTSVSATGPDDVWAVGMERGFDPEMLVLHWDGTSFERLPTPQIDSQFVALDGVVAIAEDNAWAVGYRLGPNFENQPLSIHWDGRRWSRVSVTATGRTSASLEDVTVTDSGEVWAVGVVSTGAGMRPLAVVRRDGVWTSPDGPASGEARFLGVAPLPGDRLIAVGFTSNNQGDSRAVSQVHDPVTGWAAVPTAPVQGDDFLFGVATVPGRTVSWSVGNRRPTDIPDTLIERRCD